MAKKWDETKLQERQKIAAHLLLEREMQPTKERKTKNEIADEVGISRMQLWRWEHEDDNFIGYYNHIAQKFVDSQLAFVYSKLLSGIENGSMKGIELYLKQAGKLIDKKEVDVSEKGFDVDEERDRVKQALKRLQDGSLED